MSESALEERRFYMKDIERAVDRNRSTIRVWDEKGWLPEELAFKRDENGWRYWSQDQVDMAKDWMSTRNSGRVAAGRRTRAGRRRSQDSTASAS